MKFITKSLLGAGAAAAALVSISVPAQARDRYDRDRDGISAGEIIAGAVVLGGLAAVLSAADNGRDYGYDGNDGYDYNRAGYNYNRGGNGRAAVHQCVTAVERWANGYSRSDVTQIRSIERTRYGYRVMGNLVVQDGRGRDYNNGYGGDRYNQGDRYDQGDRYNDSDRYDRNSYGRGYDKGRFICTVERGRVVDVDYRGLDRWR